jgi:hypothetical protein
MLRSTAFLSSLGQYYRTGLFLGDLMELMANGYAFALVSLPSFKSLSRVIVPIHHFEQISRYITLKRYRQPRMIEQAAIYGAGLLGAYVSHLSTILYTGPNFYSAHDPQHSGLHSL